MHRFKTALGASLLAIVPMLAYAEGIEGGPKQTTNWSAIGMFVAFVFPKKKYNK
jgi:hypothetical protein